MTIEQLNTLTAARQRALDLECLIAEYKDLLTKGSIRNFSIFQDPHHAFMTGVFRESDAGPLRLAIHTIINKLLNEKIEAYKEFCALLEQVTVPDNFGLPF